MSYNKALENLRIKFHSQLNDYIPKEFVFSKDTVINTETIEHFNKFNDVSNLTLIETKVTKNNKILSYYYSTNSYIGVNDSQEKIADVMSICYFQVYTVNDGYISYNYWETKVISYIDGYREQLHKAKLLKEEQVRLEKLRLENIKYQHSGIYLLEDFNNGIYKIGCSTNCMTRLNSHKTSNPCLKLLYIIHTRDLSLEKEIHSKFSELLFPNTSEWFYMDDSILNYFKDAQV